MPHRYDVTVIGAGLAGLAAARELAEAGRSVLVLEARDRVGGRGWTSTFPGTDLSVELGGAWFTPHQPLVRAEVERYGLGVREFEPVTETRWRTEGQLRLDAPFPTDDQTAVDAMARMEQDAARLAAGESDPLFLESLDGYLDAIAAPASVRDLAYGWWTITGGGRPDEGCVEGLLGALAAEGPLGDMGYLRYAPQPGWSALAEAMSNTPGVDVELGRPVSQVYHEDDIIEVRTPGASFLTTSVVVAVPINTLSDIRFTPALPDRIEEGYEGSAGRALKVWMLTRGVRHRALAFGRGEGLHWLYGDRVVDDLTLVVGFGWSVDGFDPTNREHLERSLHCFFPDAELVDHTMHDWITDPASHGTWANSIAGRPHLLHPERWTPDGRIAFATSDVAADHQGWFEGALASGIAAARALLSGGLGGA